MAGKTQTQSSPFDIGKGPGVPGSPGQVQQGAKQVAGGYGGQPNPDGTNKFGLVSIAGYFAACGKLLSDLGIIADSRSFVVVSRDQGTFAEDKAYFITDIRKAEAEFGYQYYFVDTVPLEIRSTFVVYEEGAVVAAGGANAKHTALNANVGDYFGSYLAAFGARNWDGMLAWLNKQHGFNTAEGASFLNAHGITQPLPPVQLLKGIPPAQSSGGSIAPANT